jgi:hypothetical protein
MKKPESIYFPALIYLPTISQALGMLARQEV